MTQFCFHVCGILPDCNSTAFYSKAKNMVYWWKGYFFTALQLVSTSGIVKEALFSVWHSYKHGTVRQEIKHFSHDSKTTINQRNQKYLDQLICAKWTNKSKPKQTTFSDNTITSCEYNYHDQKIQWTPTHDIWIWHHLCVIQTVGSVVDFRLCNLWSLVWSPVVEITVYTAEET